MKKREVETKSNFLNKKVIISLVIVLLIVSLYFTFFSTSNCKDITCFDKALKGCRKAKFSNVQDDATWVYAIKGMKEENCIVNVKSINVMVPEAKNIENKEMVCSIPSGIVISPESELDNCHGILKEELQNIIMVKLHRYIVENLGKISDQLTNPLGS